jgi:hypothetical protein
LVAGAGVVTFSTAQVVGAAWLARAARIAALIKEKGGDKGKKLEGKWWDMVESEYQWCWISHTPQLLPLAKQ